MNFEFSEEQLFIQQQARTFLSAECSSAQVREVLDSEQPVHAALWQQVKELGWPATAIDEAHGGLGLGYLELCVLAEEVGRSLLPAPMTSSVYLATEALKLAGSEAQKKHWLPLLASGDAVGTLAVTELDGKAVEAVWLEGKLTGYKRPVADATLADFAVVAAQEPDQQGYSLFLVETAIEGVSSGLGECLDPSRPLGWLEFQGADAQRLGEPGHGEQLVSRLLDGAAVLIAFEQVGGAQAALDMARQYTLQRYAFGRPVASFQAIKHKLADMFVAIELARANAYYGAWALSNGAAELPLAAATARVSAGDAYWLASKENIQAHGGMGFTWEFDCHLYYRRAQHLSLLLGGQRIWKQRLVAQLRVAA